MADTIVGLRHATGAALYTQVEGAGGIWNGAAAAWVPFAVGDWALYAVATAETPPASGRYLWAFPPAAPAGLYRWWTYRQAGAVPAAGDVVATAGESYWDGTTLGGAAGVAAVGATLDGYAAIAPEAVVSDAAPTTGAVVIALADGRPVPATFVWRNNEAWWTSGGLLGGKYPIATYSRLSTGTARLTFSPVLPVAPAHGDTLLLG